MMVSLTEGADGVVTLRFAEPYADRDEADYLAALERISDRAAPFVLLTIFAGRRKLSQAGERAQALWFKRTRARMNSTCRALAMVRADASEAMAETFRKLWGFPIVAGRSEDEVGPFLMQHRISP